MAGHHRSYLIWLWGITQICSETTVEQQVYKWWGFLKVARVLWWNCFVHWKGGLMELLDVQFMSTAEFVL